MMFVAKIFVKYPVIAFMIFEKKFVVVAFVRFAFVIVAFPKIGLFVNMYVT